MRTSAQITAEIEEKLGFFPPFFAPAQESAQVLENLWQQTLGAYIDNPLSPLFKEKLSAYLSRYCPVPYCMICHSCSLRPLGVKAQEVLQLLESPPPTENEIDEHLSILAAQPDGLTVLPKSNSTLEESLLYCSIFIALEREQAEYCRSEVRRLLGAVNYQHLVSFIAYVKTCHAWMEAHPEIAYNYEADKRSHDHLGYLLKDEPGLADFFKNYSEKVRRERLSWAQQLVQIRERKRNEEALRQSEQKYRSVVDSVKEVIFQTDVAGLWTFLNPAWTEITGFTIAESIGTNFFDYIHPDDRQLTFERLQPLIEHQQEDCRYEIRYLTKHGGFRWVEAFFQVILNAEGKITGTSGTLHDITERKQAEAEIRKALEIEKELSDLKSRFVTMASHEFRTPLTTILSSAELLKHYSHKLGEEKKSTHFGRIQTSVQHMTELLNDVLLIGQADAGKLEFNPAPVDLVQLCLSLVEELQPTASSQYFQITTRCPIVFCDRTQLQDLRLRPPSPPNLEESGFTPPRFAGHGSPLWGWGETGGHNDSVYVNPELTRQAPQDLPLVDEKLLRHILSNLLSNAIKYSPKGGTVRFEFTSTDAEAIFQIADEGIGIPPEDQKRLFESFHRASNVGQIPGTGLGLAIVKKSVDLHGGKIEVNSAVGKGSTFTVTLPLQQFSFE